MQTGFGKISILFLVLLGLGISAAFFKFNNSNTKQEPPKQNKQIEVKNISTYKNTNLKFTFQYTDEDFKVVSDTEEDYSKRAKTNFRKNFNDYVSYDPPQALGAALVLESNDFNSSPFTVWVFDNPQNLDSQKWYSNFWYYPFVWGDFDNTKEKVRPQELVLIDGKEAKYNIVTYGLGKPKFIYLPIDGKMFLFKIPTDKDTGNKILSTVKFLE